MKIRALEVTELNEYVKRILNDDPILSNIKVKGEISNFKIHSSGNVYLSLKDEKSKINCMIHRNNFDRKLDLDNGKKIIAEGYISSYIRDGVYQLYIRKIEIEGQGRLYLEFLKLKEKLQKEGLFNLEHKKRIKRFPKAIGVITSPTGAVIRDIINVVKRRYPKIDIKLYPVLVQGENSADNLVEGLEFFNESNNVDTIIIGRGGGSLEELWSFNEEKLARAIFASEIPVISAVGHETDFTICDFVSDMRAPTPSAAAEIATPNLEDLIATQNNILRAVERYVNNTIVYNRQRIDSDLHRFKLFYERSMFDDRYMELDRFKEKIDNLISLVIREEKEKLNIFSKGMANLNPFSVLERGYTIVEKNGLAITSKEEVELGERLDLILKDGKIKCEVVEK
ncbi:exodeoxyribonuclease VII large subunit [Peptostreptococcus russellii]|uniref:exodeoxyribonuclease VII large subunit n=2 Tax=Peptostreptococcus russellii TaxID=215200 RepID=UPI0026ED3434|nr:exodeoxyribonuclease VII large subunit [Peptostreptococcus russellii]